jgi:hypothetical protein
MRKAYVQTILYAYPHFKNITERIDAEVEKRALKSMGDTSSCLSQCEKIIKLTFQKATIVKLKHFVDMILNRMTAENKAYIMHKYFKIKNRKYLTKKALSKRSYFRKQQKLLEEFSKSLETCGIDWQWFKDNAVKVPFINKLYKIKVMEIVNKNSSCKEDKCFLRINSEKVA